MAFSDHTVVSALALITFLAGILASVRGGFTYPLELFILALLGLLLIISFMVPGKDAASSLLQAIFFTAAIANTLYLYSVAGYLSPARLGAISVAVIGLLMAGAGLMMQPVPAALRSEVKKLIAAEKKLTEAKQRLERVNAEKPKAAKHLKRRNPKARIRGKGSKRL
ncbi:hypothetical protein HYU17_01415 [Candidatus Woesearchaeota archaeon]|nr:hypothetical protein [Candidatus Woesearchaeota archaeon]